MLALLFDVAHAAPDYFASVANKALRIQGNAQLSQDTNSEVILALEQQVKRVMGADPTLPLNVSSIRDREDPELLRILFLAVIGNFTSAASAEWSQPCALVINAETGGVELKEFAQTESLALKVVVVLLVVVQLHRKIVDTKKDP